MNEAQLKTIESYDKTAESFARTIGRIENYNHTYDFLIDRLNDGDTVADLACGPAQISSYIKSRKEGIKITGVDLSGKMLSIARENIPEGSFHKKSIIDFRDGNKYDAVIIGFGIPYLDETQTERCLKNASELIRDGKYLYLSFMHGNSSRIEKTSFGGENEFLIYYHDKERIKRTLLERGLDIIREYELDYIESDGSITKDIVLIARKNADLVIKQCKADDIEALRKISYDTYNDTFREMNTRETMDKYLNEAFAREKLLAELSNPGCSFFFIYSGRECPDSGSAYPAGYLKLNTAPSQTDINDPLSLEIERIYVVREYKGKGLGKVLINYAAQNALELGKKYLWLGVWEKNEEALSFYKKMGFEIEGKHSFRMGDEIQSDFVMKKML